MAFVIPGLPAPMRAEPGIGVSSATAIRQVGPHDQPIPDSGLRPAPE
jgi:hypothetical protein